eukprot:m.234538 g.234538  ORF g.234538 m.234538 type:complete len:116 (+) comp40111_c0_seq74:1738-2085(+)
MLGEQNLGASTCKDGISTNEYDVPDLDPESDQLVNLSGAIYPGRQEETMKDSRAYGVLPFAKNAREDEIEMKQSSAYARPFWRTGFLKWNTALFVCLFFSLFYNMQLPGKNVAFL